MLCIKIKISERRRWKPENEMHLVDVHNGMKQHRNMGTNECKEMQRKTQVIKWSIARMRENK